jgi:energy-coupling factor transport system permease protein
MKPLKFIKIPVHDIALIMNIALRFIPTLMEEIDKIIRAQKARGADFDTGGLIKRAKAMLPILIPLFVSAFRRADELALALDARCYSASKNRTKMKVLRFKLIDFFAAFVFLAFLAGIILIKYLLPALL